MTYYRRNNSDQEIIWLPSDLVREAAKISYQKYYECNRRIREDKIRMLRKIYRPTFLNWLFEYKLMNYFILQPHDDIDGERFVELINLLPSDKIWNLQFAYCAWRPQINLCWNVYRRTLTNLGNSKVMLTREEARFIQQHSCIKLMDG